MTDPAKGGVAGQLLLDLKANNGIGMSAVVPCMSYGKVVGTYFQ